MNKIAIILPYFGKWPEWIDLYIYSCTQNTEIDWHFFTDCEVKASQKNTFFHQIAFADYCQVISERLQIDFKPATAYKLCDVRPFFGYVHTDLLLDYKFWGYGDVDVIWGNIKSFYTDDLLEKYDVFSTHSDRLSGHLAILRNEDKYTELCFKITDWQNKLLMQENLALDEFDFSNLLYPASNYIRKFYRKIMQRFMGWRNAWVVFYSVLPFINWLMRVKYHKLYFKEQHTTPILSDDGKTCKHDADIWYYKNSEVTNNKTSQKYIYLHFMILKKNSFRKIYYWKDDFYRISSTFNYSKGVIINKTGLAEL